MKNNWPVKKLGEIYDITSSKRVFKSEWRDTGIPFYRAREIVSLARNKPFKTPIFISKEMYDEYSHKYGVPQAGDILVTGVGTLGISYVVKENDKFYFKDGNIVWFKKKINVDTDFIELFLRSSLFKSQVKAKASGATVGTFTIKTANEIVVPFPSIDEQKKIVKILEEKLSKVKEAIILREEAIADTEKILSSRLTEIFEDGKKQGWEEKRLDDKSILLMTSGGTPSRSNKTFYQGNIPWLKSGELNDNLNILTSEEHISDEAVKKSSAKVFPAGAVLFAMYGATAGKLGVLGMPAATNQAVAALIPMEGRLLNVYLYYFLMMKREQIISKAWGGAQPNLSQTIIKTFSVPVPDFETQKKIVEELDELSSKVFELRKLQETQLADLKALEQAYLREAFNGDFV